MDNAIRKQELSEALELIHFGFRRIIKEPDRILSRRRLGRVHHRILYFVGKSGGMSIGELIAMLGVTKQALHRPLQQLVAGGLVDSSPLPENRRKKIVRLTRQGVAFEERLSGLQRQMFAAAFAAAGPQAEAGWRAVMRELGQRNAAR